MLAAAALALAPAVGVNAAACRFGVPAGSARGDARSMPLRLSDAALVGVPGAAIRDGVGGNSKRLDVADCADRGPVGVRSTAPRTKSTLRRVDSRSGRDDVLPIVSLCADDSFRNGVGVGVGVGLGDCVCISRGD